MNAQADAAMALQNVNEVAIVRATNVPEGTIVLERSKAIAPRNAIFPFIKAEYIKILRRQGASVLEDEDHEKSNQLKAKLKDYQSVIARADHATFFDRDGSTVGPLLDEAEEALSKEFKQAKRAHDSFRRDEVRTALRTHVLLPCQRRLIRIRRDQRYRKALVADLRAHLG